MEMDMEMEQKSVENLVQDPTSEEAFVKPKREMQEAILFKTLPQSFEEFEQIIEDIKRGLKDEITQLAHKEQEFDRAWARTEFSHDESWQLLFRDMAEVKQAKNYLCGMSAQLTDIISKGKQEMSGATRFFPPVLPDTTDLEVKTDNLRLGGQEKKFALQLLSTYRCGQLFITQFLELKLQKAFSAGKLDQIKLLAKWYQLFVSPREEVSGDNFVGASSVWSRVDELENWLSTPGNPLVVNHSI